jgi:26S proteasome non-ATPase regulatory subunit 10
MMMMITGDAAIALLKAGAEADKKDVDGFLPLDVAPGKDVRFFMVRKLIRGETWLTRNRFGNTSSGRQRRRVLSCRPEASDHMSLWLWVLDRTWLSQDRGGP